MAEGVIEEEGFPPARFRSQRCRDRRTGATVFVVRDAEDTERSIHLVPTAWEKIVDKGMDGSAIVLLANDSGRSGYDQINPDGSAAGHWTEEEAAQRLAAE